MTIQERGAARRGAAAGEDGESVQTVERRSAAPGPSGRAGARRISRQSLADQVADTLRSMILTGEIAPETPVTQSGIASLLEVSTMPAREALLRLGAEGFLIAAPNRSFTVGRITEEDIRDIYWMHAELAGALTRRACERVDDHLRERLQACEHDFVVACEQRDAAAMDAANWRFHREINLAAAAPKLWMLLKATLRYIPTGFYVLVPDWAIESERGHGEILQAVLDGDCDAAAAAAAAHVRSAGELLISSFWGDDAWKTPDGDVEIIASGG